MIKRERGEWLLNSVPTVSWAFGKFLASSSRLSINKIICQPELHLHGLHHLLFSVSEFKKTFSRLPGEKSICSWGFPEFMLLDVSLSVSNFLTLLYIFISLKSKCKKQANNWYWEEHNCKLKEKNGNVVRCQRNPVIVTKSSHPSFLTAWTNGFLL